MISSLASSFVLSTLSVLASGYVVYDAPVCRWFWPRYTGYILYFRIITAGLILLFLLYALTIYVDFTFIGLGSEHASLLTFPVAVVLRILAKGIVWVICKCTPEWIHKLQLKDLDERGFEQFVYEKIRDREMIMVTLESKKVYAGWPLEIPNNEEKKWLRFVPRWSGYRDETSTIDIRIDYSRVFGTSPLDRNRMLIPVEKIVTVQPFDPEVFREFNPKSQAPRH